MSAQSIGLHVDYSLNENNKVPFVTDGDLIVQKWAWEDPHLPSKTDFMQGVNLLLLDQSDVPSDWCVSPAGTLSDGSPDIWHRNPSVHIFFSPVTQLRVKWSEGWQGNSQPLQHTCQSASDDDNEPHNNPCFCYTLGMVKVITGTILINHILLFAIFKHEIKTGELSPSITRASAYLPIL